MIISLKKINENRIYDKLFIFAIIISSISHLVLVNLIKNINFAKENLPIDLSLLLENPVSSGMGSFNLLGSDGIRLISIKLIGDETIASKGSEEDSGGANEGNALNSPVVEDKNTDLTKSENEPEDKLEQLEKFADNYTPSFVSKDKDFLGLIVTKNKNGPDVISKKPKGFNQKL